MIPPALSRMPTKALVTTGAVVVAVAIAVVAWPRGVSNADLIAVVIAGRDNDEVAAAIDELVREPDVEGMREIVSAAPSDPSLAPRLASIRDGLIARLAAAAPEESNEILAALVPVDDTAVATALVDTIVSDEDASVRAAATQLVTQLDEAQAEAIAGLIQARSDGRGDADDVEDALRAIGDPALDVVAAIGLRQAWTLAFLESVGRSGLEPLRVLISTGRLADLEKATYQLIKVEKVDSEAAAPLWREVMDGLLDLVTPSPRRATYLSDMLHDVERVRPGVARRVQKKIVDVLLPQLNRGFAVSDALAHVGKVAVPRLIEIARSGTQFMSQEQATRVDHARLALISMVTFRPKAIEPLVKELQRRDYELIADLMLFYISLGKRGSEPTLIEALDRFGDPILALQLLNSGNGKLATGARNWAARNGYSVTGSYSGPGSWATAGRP